MAKYNKTQQEQNNARECESTNNVQTKKNNKRNRNRRGYDTQDKKNEIINNAAWYIKDPELRKQVSSYNMNGAIGIPIKLHYNSAVTPGLSQTPFSVNIPSIISILCNPSPGFTPDPESGLLSKAAINRAARKLYADISSINSKTTQYQPQDLAFAILAVGEIISMVSHLSRVYGVAFNYAKRNRDLPDVLIKALRVDPNSLNDLAQFRIRLNKILVTANQITMFSNIPYFTKCWDMYASIYTDSDSTMAQLYCMVPYSTWVMDENTELGTQLKTNVLQKSDGSLLTANEWLDVLETQIDTLLDSSTYNYIYTDILNYAGKKGSSLYAFGYVSEMYRVAPMYNLEFLMQMHNLVCYGVPTNNDVTQSVVHNAIQFSPQSESNYACLFADKLIDFPNTSNPTDDDKINAIIYHTVAVAGGEVNPGSKTYTVHDAALADHYPVLIELLAGNKVYTCNSTIKMTSAHATEIIDMSSKFDWAPIIYIKDDSSNITGVLGDLNFTDTIDYDTVKETFDYALLGVFTLDEGK